MLLSIEPEDSTRSGHPKFQPDCGEIAGQTTGRPWSASISLGFEALVVQAQQGFASENLSEGLLWLALIADLVGR